MLYGLKDAGFEAYIVGGGVRDLLAGVKPKDFDVATNAHPEQIRKVFRSARLIGRRFLIAHVRMGEEIVEVTTFRGPIGDSHDRDETGRILSDNIYGGTVEEDALRRDFSINALYYDIRDHSIVDYVGGMEDMKAKTLRLIGDPELRYREDPVRMLRSVRIGNKLHFRLDQGAVEPLHRLAPLLKEIPPARLFDEVLKLLLSSEAVENFRALHWFGLWQELFPDTDVWLEREPERARAFIEAALGNTAERIKQGQPVSPSFLFAALLWLPVQARAAELQAKQGHNGHLALVQASEEAVARQSLRVAIPRRFSVPAKEIWHMQPRLEQRHGRSQRLVTHPRFRAGYDFLLLRAQSGEPVKELAEWWTKAQEGQVLPVPEGAQPPPARGRRRRRRGRGGGGQGPRQGPGPAPQ